MQKISLAFLLCILLLVFVSSNTLIHAASTLPKHIPGKTAEKRLKFLYNIDENNLMRQKYYELALYDSDPRVREAGTNMIGGNMKRIAPILLKLVTTDSSQEVRQSAALCLSREFTSNGVEYSDEDVRALEKNLETLSKAIKDKVGSRYILEVLDIVWCDLQVKTKTMILQQLAIPPSNNTETSYLNEYANEFLQKHKTVSCEKS